ncbi:hypothetical protein [Comamonas guangdongensis]|uniref:Uncharacterized protein n=1 Tax=Comamonas guangdongensis TaxID=510515 RepID=A0ABV4A025_9BURK
MKKILTTVAVACAALAIPYTASAQFSIPSFGGSKSSAPAADLSGQQTTLVKNFVAANVDVLKANAKMSEALGLKATAADAEAVAQQLSSGSTFDKDSASKAATAVGDSGGAIAAKLAEKPQLDAAAKVTYTQGLLSLAKGAVRYKGLGQDVTSMGDGLKSAPLTQLPSLGGATYVVSQFPTSTTEVIKALKNAVDFAKSNGIEVPKEATSLL